MRTVNKIKDIKEYFSKRKEVAFLYGSQAKGTSHLNFSEEVKNYLYK